MWAPPTPPATALNNSPAPGAARRSSGPKPPLTVLNRLTKRRGTGEWLPIFPSPNRRVGAQGTLTVSEGYVTVQIPGFGDKDDALSAFRRSVTDRLRRQCADSVTARIASPRGSVTAGQWERHGPICPSWRNALSSRGRVTDKAKPRVARRAGGPRAPAVTAGVMVELDAWVIDPEQQIGERGPWHMM